MPKLIIRKKIFLTSLTVFTLFLVSLFTAEIFLRKIKKHDKLKLNLSTRNVGENRILIIGDGVSDFGLAKSYPQKLQKILLKKSKSKRDVVFTETSIGNNSDKILKELDGLVAKYRPNIVITMVGANDEEISLNENSIEDKEGLLSWIKSKSSLARTLYSVIKKEKEIAQKDLKLGKYAEREFELKSILLKKPLDAENYFNLGRFYYELNAYTKAADIFKKAMNFKVLPTTANVYWEAAESFLHSGNLKKSSIMFSFYANKIGGFRPHLDIAQFLLNKSNNEHLDIVTDHLLKALSLSPPLNYSLIILKHLYQIHKGPNFEDNWREIEKITEYSKVSIEYFLKFSNLLGKSLIKARLSSYAQAAYQNALAFSESSEKQDEKSLRQPIWEGLIYSLRLQGKYEEAKKNYDLGYQENNKIRSVWKRDEFFVQNEMIKEIRLSGRSIYSKQKTILNYQKIQQRLSFFGIKHIILGYPQEDLKHLEDSFTDKTNLTFVNTHSYFSAHLNEMLQPISLLPFPVLSDEGGDFLAKELAKKIKTL